MLGMETSSGREMGMSAGWGVDQIFANWETPQSPHKKKKKKKPTKSTLNDLISVKTRGRFYTLWVSISLHNCLRIDTMR